MPRHLPLAGRGHAEEHWLCRASGSAGYSIRCCRSPEFFLNALSSHQSAAAGLPGWPVFFGVSDLEERTEQEPNNDLAHANASRFPPSPLDSSRATTLDCFTFAAKKGQRLDIEVQSIEWNSPTEVYMVVKDAGCPACGGEPSCGPDDRFHRAADGDFTVVVEHLLT